MENWMATILNVALAAEQLDVLTLVKDSTGAVMAVLIILVAMSLISWYIIAMKAVYLSKARRQSERFQGIFRRALVERRKNPV